MIISTLGRLQLFLSFALCLKAQKGRNLLLMREAHFNGQASQVQLMKGLCLYLTLLTKMHLCLANLIAVVGEFTSASSLMVFQLENVVGVQYV